jgi:hypothetical protein
MLRLFRTRSLLFRESSELRRGLIHEPDHVGGWPPAEERTMVQRLSSQLERAVSCQKKGSEHDLDSPQRLCGTNVEVNNKNEGTKQEKEERKKEV